MRVILCLIGRGHMPQNLRKSEGSFRGLFSASSSELGFWLLHPSCVFQAYELPAASPVFTSHLSTGVLGLQMHAAACHVLQESLELNCLLACTPVLVHTEQRPACIAQRLKAHTYSRAVVCPLRCWAFPSIICWSTSVISAPKRNWKQEVQDQAGLWDTGLDIRLEIYTN